MCVCGVNRPPQVHVMFYRSARKDQPRGPGRAGKFYAHEEERHALNNVMWTASEGDSIITCVAVARFLTTTGVGEGAPGVATQ